MIKVESTKHARNLLERWYISVNLLKFSQLFDQNNVSKGSVYLKLHLQMLHIFVQMLHHRSCKQLQIRHFCHISLLLERPGAKNQSFLPKSPESKRAEAIKHPSFSFLVTCSHRVPSGISRGCGWMGKGEAEVPFLARVIVKHLLCPFHHPAQALCSHQQRGSRAQQAAWSGLHQLAEPPSEGLTYSIHLEIPDKLRCTPSRLLEPT